MSKENCSKIKPGRWYYKSSLLKEEVTPHDIYLAERDGNIKRLEEKVPELKIKKIQEEPRKHLIEGGIKAGVWYYRSQETDLVTLRELRQAEKDGTLAEHIIKNRQ